MFKKDMFFISRVTILILFCMVCFVSSGCSFFQAVTGSEGLSETDLAEDDTIVSSSKTVYVKVYSANIREGAGTHFKVITSVMRGTALKARDWDEKWSYVALPDGRSGYIYMSLTTDQEVAPVKAEAPVKKVAPVKAAAPVKKVAPVKATAPVKEVAPVKAAAPAKKVESVKKIEPVEAVGGTKEGNSTKPPWLQ